MVNLSILMERPTGISTYAKNLLPHLGQFQPTLLSAAAYPSYRCYKIPADMTPEQGWRGHCRRLLWLQTQLPKLYRQAGSTLLFSPLPEMPLFQPCRTVVTVHDLIPLRFPSPLSPLGPYFRYYVPAVLQQAEHILCDSEATARDVTRFCQVSAKKLTVVPLACDTEHFRPLDLPRKNYFLYIGRHAPHKNLGRLINAFQSVAQKTDAELWIAGPEDARYTPQYRQQAQELELAARIRFVGYVDDRQIAVLMNQTIGLVMPSLWEGFGLPALEAMACGTPVIASKTGSLPEITENAALMVDPYSIEEIAAALQAVMGNPSLWQQLHQSGLEQAKQFSWQKTGKATADVLKQYL